MWMGIFLISILASFLLGRIYCGWICPINTLMKFVTVIKKRLHIKEIKIPKYLQKPWLRIFTLILFIGTFVFAFTSGKKLPVLPVLLGIGVFVTLFFPEEFWHFYLCPYGTIFSITGKNSKHNMVIDQKKCNNCTMCQRVCPAKAVEKREKHFIVKGNCLVCMECTKYCKQDAISYN